MEMKTGEEGEEEEEEEEVVKFGMLEGDKDTRLQSASQIC